MTSTIPRLALAFALILLASCQSTVQVAEEQRPATPEPRTVFGEPPQQQQARQRAAPTPRTLSETQLPREEVATMLYRWAATYTSRDLKRHMDLYAQKLDRFYDRTNVRRASVLTEKQRLLARSRSRRPQIRDVSLNEEDGGRLVIAEFRRLGEQAGAVRQRLVWKKLRPGDWRIIREEVL